MEDGTRETHDNQCDLSMTRQAPIAPSIPDQINTAPTETNLVCYHCPDGLQIIWDRSMGAMETMNSWAASDPIPREGSLLAANTDSLMQPLTNHHRLGGEGKRVDMSATKECIVYKEAVSMSAGVANAAGEPHNPQSKHSPPSGNTAQTHPKPSPASIQVCADPDLV